VDDLTGKQRRYLRGLAHHLDAVVYVGANGVTEAVLDKTRTELAHHEIIKVRLGEGCDLDRHEVGFLLAEGCDAHLVQTLGRVNILYRAREEEPGIELPS